MLKYWAYLSCEKGHAKMVYCEDNELGYLAVTSSSGQGYQACHLGISVGGAVVPF